MYFCEELIQISLLTLEIWAMLIRLTFLFFYNHVFFSIYKPYNIFSLSINHTKYLLYI